MFCYFYCNHLQFSIYSLRHAAMLQNNPDTVLVNSKATDAFN